MADQIHFALSKFRNTMLSAVAELEFELRDAVRRPEPVREIEHHNDNQYDSLVRKMEFLETTLKQVLSSGLGAHVDVQQCVEGLLQVEPVANSRNVLISVKNTPALAAAVVAAVPPEFDLETEEGEEAEEIEVEDEEDEEEDEEEVEDEEEEEEEAEEVEETKAVEEEGEVEEDAKEAEEEEEEEEEAIEVEEFEYKGKTYQRDAEGTVYLDGEEIGTWNGKKIVLG